MEIREGGSRAGKWRLCMVCGKHVKPHEDGSGVCRGLFVVHREICNEVRQICCQDVGSGREQARRAIAGGRTEVVRTAIAFEKERGNRAGILNALERGLRKLEKTKG